MEVSEEEEGVHEGCGPSGVHQKPQEGVGVEDYQGVDEALMSSLSIIDFYPVSIGQNISIEVVSDVWVPVLVDLLVSSECLPVLFAKLGIYQSQVLGKSGLPDPCVLHLQLEAA